MFRFLGFAILLATFTAGNVNAGTQREEDLSDSVRTHMCGQISDYGVPRLFFDSPEEEKRWLGDMSLRLKRILPKNSILQDPDARRNFLTALHYNAQRAAIDPQVVLAVIHVESAFRKYAISSAGARGYMQVMPFWVKNIGGDKPCGSKHNLFRLNTNLRYGTVILSHYLSVENGNLYRALARYNGSLGKPKYPNAVYKKLEKYWLWE